MNEMSRKKAIVTGGALGYLFEERITQSGIWTNNGFRNLMELRVFRKGK